MIIRVGLKKTRAVAGEEEEGGGKRGEGEGDGGGEGGYVAQWEGEHCDHGELYDLINDPEENRNIIFNVENKETIKMLSKILRNKQLQLS